MLRASFVFRLVTKPITQGYVAAFPQPRVGTPKRLVRQAMAANAEVADLFTMDSERYDAWFQETYGVDDVSSCPTMGPSSNKSLDDALNLSNADAFDEKACIEELEHWNRTFQKRECVK